MLPCVLTLRFRDVSLFEASVVGQCFYCKLHLLLLLLLLLSWCLMSSDVIWHIRDKLWPMPKHGSIRKVYACLAVTCHLHFWQNDRDFLRAIVVTRGWNGYRNKSQHRKSTLEKKILPPFQQGFEPATFQSRVQCSNHWAIPAPIVVVVVEVLLYVHRNRRFIRDGSSGRPPRLSHSSWVLQITEYNIQYTLTPRFRTICLFQAM